MYCSSTANRDVHCQYGGEEEKKKKIKDKHTVDDAGNSDESGTQVHGYQISGNMRQLRLCEAYGYGGGNKDGSLLICDAVYLKERVLASASW